MKENEIKTKSIVFNSDSVEYMYNIIILDVSTLFPCNDMTV